MANRVHFSSSSSSWLGVGHKPSANSNRRPNKMSAVGGVSRYYDYENPGEE